MGKIFAPFTDQQVGSINKFQQKRRDWALRLGEIIELLDEADEEGGNTIKIREAKAYLQDVQQELLPE